MGVAGLLLWNYAKDFFGGLTCLFMIEETWSQGSATFLWAHRLSPFPVKLRTRLGWDWVKGTLRCCMQRMNLSSEFAPKSSSPCMVLVGAST